MNRSSTSSSLALKSDISLNSLSILNLRYFFVLTITWLFKRLLLLVVFRISDGLIVFFLFLDSYHFRNNNLQKDDVVDLHKILIKLPNLRDLDISCNPIMDEGIRYCLI